jgi:NADH-quinone oxidoreductase subunit J
MTILSITFYLLAFVIAASTVIAITRRNVVHAVVYLTLSFLGTGLLFFQLGAPLLAVFEVIIYAGAIMVLFIFIIMVLGLEADTKSTRLYLRSWLPAILLGGITLAAAVLVIETSPERSFILPVAMASPLEFGRFLYQHYWLPVEITSFLLFVALVGALYLGRRDNSLKQKPEKENI